MAASTLSVAYQYTSEQNDTEYKLGQVETLQKHVVYHGGVEMKAKVASKNLVVSVQKVTMGARRRVSGWWRCQKKQHMSLSNVANIHRHPRPPVRMLTQLFAGYEIADLLLESSSFCIMRRKNGAYYVALHSQNDHIRGQKYERSENNNNHAPDCSGRHPIGRHSLRLPPQTCAPILS
eukprot:SAG31_NODE_4067_length_3622_cov_17.161510_4_plen_178_part_00